MSSSSSQGPFRTLGQMLHWKPDTNPKARRLWLPIPFNENLLSVDSPSEMFDKFKSTITAPATRGFAIKTIDFEAEVPISQFHTWFTLLKINGAGKFETPSEALQYAPPPATFSGLDEAPPEMICQIIIDQEKRFLNLPAENGVPQELVEVRYYWLRPSSLDPPTENEPDSIYILTYFEPREHKQLPPQYSRETGYLTNQRPCRSRFNVMGEPTYVLATHLDQQKTDLDLEENPHDAANPFVADRTGLRSSRPLTLLYFSHFKSVDRNVSQKNKLLPTLIRWKPTPGGGDQRGRMIHEHVVSASSDPCPGVYRFAMPGTSELTWIAEEF